MRALITGASGFIGSYLTELLVGGGESVAILCRRGSDLWRIRAVLPNLRVIEGDLDDATTYQSAMTDYCPDTVFHLAWYGVGNQHRNDVDQIDRNITSTLMLLRHAIASGCRAWIGLGSQAEYGVQSSVVDEEAVAKPTTLYGAAKLCASILAGQTAAGSETRFAWLRLFSSYGPKDNPQWMIPYLMRELLAGKRPSLTACEQLWDYIYVGDVAQALYDVAKTPSAAGVFNLGSGQAYRLRSVVELVRDAIDPTLPVGFGEVPYRPDQVMHLQADVSRLHAATGWDPRMRLEDGLERTLAWARGESS